MDPYSVAEIEDGWEEVDDVQVQGDGSQHILIVRVALDQVVGVVDDETREYDGSEATIDRAPNPSQGQKKLRVQEFHVRFSVNYAKSRRMLGM